MTPKQFYKATYAMQNISKSDTIELLKDPNYRPEGWTPDWNNAEFTRGQFELNSAIKINGTLQDRNLDFTDPRLDPHWRDDNWDDVLLDQWWRYVALEYQKVLAEELFE